MYESAKKRLNHAKSNKKGDNDIDFTWLLFIGLKLGLSEKEIGQMTIHKLMSLWTYYSIIFDKEKQGLYNNERKITPLSEL